MLDAAATELTAGYLAADEDVAGRTGTICIPRTVIPVTLAWLPGEDGEDDGAEDVFGMDEEEVDFGEVVAENDPRPDRL